jgi:hypothetical protein
MQASKAFCEFAIRRRLSLQAGRANFSLIFFASPPLADLPALGPRPPRDEPPRAWQNETKSDKSVASSGKKELSRTRKIAELRVSTEGISFKCSTNY